VRKTRLIATLGYPLAVVRKV